jgi:sugar phosphate isomerase/epimerase
MTTEQSETYNEVGMCPASLMADFMSPTGDEVRAAVEASLHSGASAASTWTLHFDALGGLESAARLLNASGLHTEVVEAASNWAQTDKAAAEREGQQIAEAAAAVGASIVMAICLEPTLDDLDRARDNLAVVVAHARDAGARTCVEFLPWTGIPDLATAWSLVEPLGPDAGVLIDAWHWQRQPGGPNLPLLASIPGDRIGYVQLCDAAPGDATDMMEAMAGRLLPGDGVIDFVPLVETLRQIDAHPFFATEVFNPGLLAELGINDFASGSITHAKQLLGHGSA